MSGAQTSAGFDRATGARTLGYLFIAGGVIAGLTLLLPHGNMVDELAIVVLAVFTAAVGGGVLAGADSMSERALHAAVVFGTAILGVANYLVGTTASYPFLYSWLALYAFAFFALRPALLHMALIAGSYLVVLAIQAPTSPVTRWLLAMGTPLVTGVVVSQLIRRLREGAEVAEERARVAGESEARTRAIVQATPDAFVTVDEKGIVVLWNREAERLFGVSYAEAVGMPVTELMFQTPEEGRESDARRARLLAELDEGAYSRYEVEMSRADGSRFPAEMSVSRVRAGETDLLAAFIRDVSQREQQRLEREQLFREQAARQEAEQMAGMVHGLQVLLDAALVHRDLDTMLGALLPRICEVLNAEAGTIALSDPDGALIVHSSTAPRVGEEPTRIELGEPVAGLVAESGEPLLLQDPEPDLPKDPALKGMGSILSVPLKAGGVVTGVIQVGVPAPRHFTEDDLLLLGLAADRVAIAIDHAKVFEREHRIAETLQSSLMPDRLPQLPGLAAAARYLPAANEAEVGGDWYDVIPMPAGRVGLVMGDVAGKGLAAASLVGRLRSAMRAYALDGHDPPAAVCRLNQHLWAEAGETADDHDGLPHRRRRRGHRSPGSTRVTCRRCSWSRRGRGCSRAPEACRSGSCPSPPTRRGRRSSSPAPPWSCTPTAWSSAPGRSSTTASLAWWRRHAT